MQMMIVSAECRVEPAWVVSDTTMNSDDPILLKQIPTQKGDFPMQ